MKGFAIGSYVQVAYLDQRHLNERVGQVHEYGKGKDGGNVIRVRFKEAILSLSSGILINQSQLKTKIRFNIALILLVLAGDLPSFKNSRSGYLHRINLSIVLLRSELADDEAYIPQLPIDNHAGYGSTVTVNVDRDVTWKEEEKDAFADRVVRMASVLFSPLNRALKGKSNAPDTVFTEANEELQVWAMQCCSVFVDRLIEQFMHSCN